MVKNANTFSALFRSIESNDTQPQVSETSAIRETEQRWPLFETLRPKKSELTPSLSEEEKRQWRPNVKANSAIRKQVLSVESINKKMAESLRRMSSTKASTLIKAGDQAKSGEIPEVKPNVIPKLTEDISKKKLVTQTTTHVDTLDATKGKEMTVRRLAPVVPRVESSKTENQNAPTQNKDVIKQKKFTKPSTTTVRIEQLPESKLQRLNAKQVVAKAALPASVNDHALPAINPDQSLANMFGRLTGEKDIKDTPAPKSATPLFKLNKK